MKDRGKHSLKLMNLSPNTTAFDLRHIYQKLQAKTCYIPHLMLYKPRKYAVISFEDEETLHTALEQQFSLRETIIETKTIQTKLCTICDSSQHLIANSLPRNIGTIKRIQLRASREIWKTIQSFQTSWLFQNCKLTQPITGKISNHSEVIEEYNNQETTHIESDLQCLANIEDIQHQQQQLHNSIGNMDRTINALIFTIANILPTINKYIQKFKEKQKNRRKRPVTSKPFLLLQLNEYRRQLVLHEKKSDKYCPSRSNKLHKAISTKISLPVWIPDYNTLDIISEIDTFIKIERLAIKKSIKEKTTTDIKKWKELHNTWFNQDKKQIISSIFGQPKKNIVTSKLINNVSTEKYLITNPLEIKEKVRSHFKEWTKQHQLHKYRGTIW
ncbi:16378_t:CDS:2 [Acaulospora colombiana]|uniref:16378_t:CDS:1 n=1 Tax=Acaulospora colombiana TaxID=27376 RepID=A0ACA9LVJ5_9GLOM|nr:16378_t:CDS:2 [Acaulospora colombiana]